MNDLAPLTGKSVQTRAGIIERARRLFYEKGYDAATFADIVAATGLSRGHINHYFKTKDDLLRAVVALRLDEIRALTQSWDATSADPRARLHAFTEMIAANALALSEFGCPIGSLNTELGKARPDLQHDARALFDLFRDWLAAQYSALDAREPQARALHLLARAQGIAVLAHVYRDPAWVAGEITSLKTWIDASASSA